MLIFQIRTVFFQYVLQQLTIVDTLFSYSFWRYALKSACNFSKINLFYDCYILVAKK